MNVEDMTPEQLRAYAAQKEQFTKDMRERYLQEQPTQVADEPKLKPWEKPITVDDLTVFFDMRRLNSRKTILLLNSYRKSISTDKRGNRHAGMSETIDLINYLFEGDVDAAVEAYVIEQKGYDDAESIYEIEGRIMEQLDIKN